MLDNNKKEENKKEEKYNVVLERVIPTFIVFIALFGLLYMYNAGLTIMEMGKENNLPIDSITLSSYTVEEELRCVGITAIYDVDGTKNYQVRFSVPNYNMYVDGVVPASLVEEDKVIDKDSKYKANITYTYSNEIFENVKSRTVFTKKYKTDEEYLNVMENTEDIVRITKVECMFSEYLNIQTEEEVQKEFENICLVDDANV